MTQEVNTTENTPLEVEIHSWNNNTIKLLWFQGWLKVGGYLLGNDYYCNRVVEIKVDGENTDILNYKERVFSRDINDSTQDHLIADIEIILEQPYLNALNRSTEITGFSDVQPVRSQFRVSKSN